MIATIFYAAWAACAVVHYGVFVNYFQTAYPTIAAEDYWLDRMAAAILAVGGPVALMTTLFFCRDRLGWRP